MTIMQIVFEDDASTFHVLTFDADIEQGHSIRAEKTQFPIERGANRSDHHRALPDEFEAEIIVTETPATGATPDDGTRRRELWDMLRAARDGHWACLITTELHTYDDQVLLGAHATVTAKDGTWLRAKLSFGELPVFDTETVEAPPAARPPRARPPVQLGSRQNHPLHPQAISLFQQLDDADALSHAGQAIVDFAIGDE